MFVVLILEHYLKIIYNVLQLNIFQLSVMAGPMNRMYGAATMAGKDEMNGRINPAMEPDDDLPVSEAQRNRSALIGGGGGSGGSNPSHTSHIKGQTAF